MISAHIKAALAAAKVQGIQLGNPGLVAGSVAQARAANAVKAGRAQAHAAEVLPFIGLRQGSRPAFWRTKDVRAMSRAPR